MRWGLCLILFFSSLTAVEIELQNPLFKEGVLTTEDGGIVRDEGLRVQARNIRYVEGVSLEAEGDLMVEYADSVFVGERFVWDFGDSTGTLYEGRSAVGPWYVGGKVVRFCADRSYVIDHGYLTTCEDPKPEYRIRARRITTRPGGWVCAEKVAFEFCSVPLLVLPRFEGNIRSFADSPLSFRADYGGLMGSRVGIRYRFLERGAFKAFLRGDYFITHGPGVGIETEYCPAGRPTQFFTQSYVARDRSIVNPLNRTRYRFAGRYDDCWGKWKIKARYDKLSDDEMETDYQPYDFNLLTARWTYFDAYRKDTNLITSFNARVRINTFQTISQQLPKVGLQARPQGWGGLMFFNRTNAVYYNFAFARSSNRQGFDATRIALHHGVYRPFHFGALTVMPGAVASGILYSDSPQNNAQFMGTVEGSVEASVRASRIFGCAKHVVQPYLRYSYMIDPTSNIPKHYIFTINDGYTRLNLMRVGVKNDLFLKRKTLCNPVTIDLFAYAFYDTPTIKGTVPRLYADISWSPTDFVTANVQTAWNVSHHRVDHFNAGLKWTLSENVAFNLLYRYRSPYVWRKSNWDNWVLDSFVPEEQLLASPLSDRRDTIMTHLFWRITPTFSAELETRNGWRRRNQPAYFEGKLSLNWVLACRWYLTVYVERWEFEKRTVNVGLNLRLGRPQW